MTDRDETVVTGWFITIVISIICATTAFIGRHGCNSSNYDYNRGYQEGQLDALKGCKQ